MFRGGDYIDKPDFKDLISKPGKNYMDTSDIPGAQPKRRFDSRHSQKLGEAGNMIIDNNYMVAAGKKKDQKEGSAVADAFQMGYQYQKYQNKDERNPLSTFDINGSSKINQYGQKMQIDQNLINHVAGQIKLKPDRFEKNLNKTYDLSAVQKGKSQIFDYDQNSKIDRENQPPIKIGEAQKQKNDPYLQNNQNIYQDNQQFIQEKPYEIYNSQANQQYDRQKEMESEIARQKQEELEMLQMYEEWKQKHPEQHQPKNQNPPQQIDVYSLQNQRYPPRDVLQQKYNAKDFSRDPYHNEWVDREAKQLSTVALQAQGHQLPPRPPQQIQRYPQGISITQDPAFMMFDPQSENQSRHSIRVGKINAQKNFESNFAKPMADRSPQTIDQLYFKNGLDAPGKRINTNKNFSSIERVFGVESLNIQGQMNGIDNSGRSSPGGKRQFAVSSSQQNLISGNYGVDRNFEADNHKPYSKHSSLIQKPIRSQQQNVISNLLY